MEKSINERREVLNYVMMFIHACTVLGCQRRHVHVRLQFEQVRRKTHPAQSRYHSSELDEGTDTLEDAHVRPSNFLGKESASQPLVIPKRSSRCEDENRCGTVQVGAHSP